MDRLSNSFSALDLPAEDDDDMPNTNVADGGKIVNNGSKGGVTQKSENGGKETSGFAPATCWMPLVWIDLEMTGLDVEHDRILEIACVVTDGNLTRLIEGPDLVIHQPIECLEKMGAWCQDHHSASGLIDRVLESNMSVQEAENKVVEFVKKHVDIGSKPLIAGNSIYTDLIFLRKYMPDLAAIFSHVVVDVSSVKALCIRWYPKDNRRAPRKENKHRAMDDIKESIAELQFFKENIFKPKSRKSPTPFRGS